MAGSFDIPRRARTEHNQGFAAWLDSLTAGGLYDIVVLVLALASAIFLAQVCGLTLFANGWTERAEWLLFVTTWPLLAATAWSLLFGAYRLIPSAFARALPLLTLANTALALLVTWIFDGNEPTSFTTATVLFILGISPLLNLVICWWLHRWRPDYTPPTYIRTFAGGFSCCVWVWVLLLSNLDFPLNALFPPVALAVALAAICTGQLTKLPTPIKIAFHAAVALLIILFTYEPALDFDLNHYNYYVGPIAAILAGRTLLVDVFSQYGVGVLYLLTGLFHFSGVGLGYFSLALGLSVLIIASLLLQYALLLKMHVRPLLAALACATIIILSYYVSMGSGTTYPSTGPLRFGLPYLLLMPWLLGMRKEFHVQIFRSFILGVAAVWSFETFVYTLAGYGALAIAAACTRSGVKPRLWAGAKDLAAGSVAIFAMHLLLVIFTYLRSGQLPNWPQYFRYVLAYTPDAGGLGLKPMPLAGLWNIIIAVYVVSLVASALRLFDGSKTAAKDDATQAYSLKVNGFVFFLSCVGLTFFTYYIGRSHWNNLCHISGPAILLTFYWLEVLTTRRPVYGVLAIAAGLAAVFSLAPTSEFFYTRLGDSLAGKISQGKGLSTANLRGISRFTSEHKGLNDILAYMQEHPRQEVDFLVGPAVAVATVIITGKASLLPLGYLPQELDLPERRALLMDVSKHYKDGTVVFFDPSLKSHINRSNKFILTLFDQVCSTFQCHLEKQLPHGYGAYRLATKEAATVGGG